MLGDPCKQIGTICPGVAAAPCGADGVWGQCICGGAQPAPVTTTNAVTQMPQCGNNIVETNLGEQCEQGMNGGATCATLVAPGSQGVVNCLACRYDTSGCMTPSTVPTGGTGATATMPQGGAGH